MTTSARRSFNIRQRPSNENTFSCAFSRTEQVFINRMSACSGSSTRTAPSLSASTSAILAESYSFIWQPMVWT